MQCAGILVSVMAVPAFLFVVIYMCVIASSQCQSIRVLVYCKETNPSGLELRQLIKVHCDGITKLMYSNEGPVFQLSYGAASQQSSSTARVVSYLLSCQADAIKVTRNSFVRITNTTFPSLLAEVNADTNNDVRISNNTSAKLIADININNQCESAFNVTGACLKSSRRGINEPGSRDGQSGGNSLVIVFSLAGCCLIGLLGFAIIRVRRAGKKIPPHGSDSHELHGIENQSLSATDTRANDILTMMNNNGGNYSMVEMDDSTPGRRIYVITQTSDQRPGLSRVRSQLSDITEEPTEEETASCGENDTELVPGDENRTIGFSNLHIEEPVEISPELRKVLSPTDNVEKECDFRYSGSDTNSYLQKFGWSPRQRCSTTSSEGEVFSVGEIPSSMSSLTSDTNDIETSDTGDMELKLPKTFVTVSSSNLVTQDGVTHESTLSLPTTLDVSNIPDIGEVLLEPEPNIIDSSEEDV